MNNLYAPVSDPEGAFPPKIKLGSESATGMHHSLVRDKL